MARTKESAAHEQEAAQGQAAVPEHFINIRKAGEPDLHIHPDALDEHKRLGWEEVEAAE